jgi:glycosyltransferase involved in cell wall biosynthesis
MRTVLFIARLFPPIGGAGVQRATKFVKYLPSLGWLPVVLAGPVKSESRWTPEDRSMIAEVPPQVPVFRAECGAATKASLPEPKEGVPRLHALVRLGEEIINKYNPELIFVTMSPFEDAWVAEELSRRHALPWIADLRDPWALDEFQVHSTRWHRYLERRKMGRSLRSAASIIMNTSEAAERLRRAFPSLAHTRVTSIPNGYDAEDFSREIPVHDETRFTIVHSGYMHTVAGLHQQRHALQYRLLGRLEPGVELMARSHFYLLKALEKWLAQDPALVDKLRLILVGSLTTEDHELVKNSPAGALISSTRYLSHTECLGFLRNADLLFLPLHKMPNGRRASIVPGKTYEYIATGKPILAALPDGDARDIVCQAGTGLVCLPDDVDAMVRILQSEYQAWREQHQAVSWNKMFVGQFERRRLTERLVEELDNVMSVHTIGSSLPLIAE